MKAIKSREKAQRDLHMNTSEKVMPNISWLKLRRIFKKNSRTSKSTNVSVASISNSIKSSLGTIDLSSPDMDEYDFDYTFHDCSYPLHEDTSSLSAFRHDLMIPSNNNLDAQEENDNRTAEELYEEGKLLFSQGILLEALTCQNKSLDMLSLSFDIHQRQAAMVRHEIAKIKYALATENNGNDIAIQNSPMTLRQLRDDAENTKCQMAMQNLKYYQEQLLNLEEQVSQERDIYDLLDILHTLGQICEKELFRLEQAQQYYKRALSIEEQMLEHMIGDGDEELTKEWAQRVKHTRRKFGGIQYQVGRFDLAMLCTFS